LRGPTSKEREGTGRGGDGKEEGKGRGKEGGERREKKEVEGYKREGRRVEEEEGKERGGKGGSAHFSSCASKEIRPVSAVCIK